MNISDYIIKKTASYIRNITIKYTIPKNRGELAKSVTISYKNNKAIIGTNKVYAKMVHFGSNKPVVIKPKNKKALRFKIKGKTLVRKKAVLYKNKPRKPDPFFQKAIDIAKQDISKNPTKIYPKLNNIMLDNMKQHLKNTVSNIKIK